MREQDGLLRALSLDIVALMVIGRLTLARQPLPRSG